jgi:hypothetical protein
VERDELEASISVLDMRISLIDTVLHEAGEAETAYDDLLLTRQA